MTEFALDSPFGWIAASGTPFGLIFFAELGDKSQLVCMTLAARHRHWPVLAGTVTAFLLLNTLAVAFGAGLSHWVPQQLLAAIVAALFATYGVLMLRAAGEDSDDVGAEKSGHGIFMTAFLMIFLAEMGDKTQIAVAGMATTLPVIPVWVGATLALTATSALGVLAGRKLLGRIPLAKVHRFGGVLFLALAVFALVRVFE